MTLTLSGSAPPPRKLSASDTGDASGLSVTATGRAVARSHADRAAERLSVKDFGAKGDGATDDTAALSAAFSFGGTITVPDGNYLIAATGSGVLADWAKPTTIVCSPNARFFTNGLDAILIRFERNIPAIQAGARLTLDWQGGVIDTSGSKLSTSHPFTGTSVTFSASQGLSDTTDGLYVHGSYQPSVGAAYLNGAVRISVRGAIFYGGAHWQNAGGDSGFYPEGADIIEAEGNKFIGLNDSGIYVSQSVDGATPGRVSIRNNYFQNCCHGADVKRGPSGFTVSGNTFINCARAIMVEWLVGGSPKAGSIRDNRVVNCGVLARVYYARYVTIESNVVEAAGAFLADGTTIVPDQIAGLYLFGTSYCTIYNNRGVGVDASHYDTTAFFIRMATYDVTVGGTTTTYDCNNNRIEANHSDGWYDFATEVGGTSNRWWWNTILNAGASGTSGVSNPGTGSTNLGVSTANQPVFNTSLTVPSGSASSPGLNFVGRTNYGFYAATGTVGFSVNGAAALTATTTNVVPAKNLVPAGDGALTNGATANRWSTTYQLTAAIGSANNLLAYAAAAPTTGTWKQGDKVWNSAPAVGSPKGWVCTVAGTPGTWVSEGNL